MKARKVGPFGDTAPRVVFWCPACEQHHAVPYSSTRPPPPGPLWYWNENTESPTIEPSLRVFQIDGKTTACHVVVTDGFLNYCGDFTSSFAGKRIAMEDCKLIE